MKKLRIGVIGTGERAKYVVYDFLKEGKGNVEVVKVYDPVHKHIEKACEFWKTAINKAESADELINSPEVDVVMIFTPNVYHCRYILASLEAGKPVFSEKPLATTLEDCRKIVEMQKKTGIPVHTGFVLRYSPIYRRVKELLDSGTFGSIINITASENRESWGGGNSMSMRLDADGWRRHRDLSGPYLLEKCSHDLDLLNWFAGCIPESAAGFGGLDLFKPENHHLWDKLGHDTFAKYIPVEERINPFTSPKDIFDNHSVIFQYPNGIKMCFQLTLANAIPERRMYISCTEGTIICECFSGIVSYRRYNDPCVYTETYAGGGHGGGDGVMQREIIDHLLNGTGSSSGVSNGLDCALSALAADESMLTGKIVKLADLMNK